MNEMSDPMETAAFDTLSGADFSAAGQTGAGLDRDMERVGKRRERSGKFSSFP
jgi:hypothetical protein